MKISAVYESIEWNTIYTIHGALNTLPILNIFFLCTQYHLGHQDESNNTSNIKILQAV